MTPYYWNGGERRPVLKPRQSMASQGSWQLVAWLLGVVIVGAVVSWLHGPFDECSRTRIATPWVGDRHASDVEFDHETATKMCKLMREGK